MKLLYPVLPGCTFGGVRVWGEGELVPLTPEEAGAHIGIVIGEAVTEETQESDPPADDQDDTKPKKAK